MSNSIVKAAHFAAKAYANTKRKLTAHSLRVAGRVTLLHNATEPMIVAAWLSGIVGNTDIPLETIKVEFGDKVAKLVGELTNVVHHSNTTRAERQAADRERLSAVSDAAKYIRAVILLDNLLEFSRKAETADKKTVASPVAESMALLEAIRVNDQQWIDLEREIWTEINNLKKLSNQ